MHMFVNQYMQLCTGKLQFPQFNKSHFILSERNVLPCMHAQLMMCCVVILVCLYRMAEMPFTCVLRMAMLPLLSSLPPWWRSASLVLINMATQPCTWQPNTDSCPWWITWSNLVDLTWKQRTRLAYLLTRSTVTVIQVAFIWLSSRTTANYCYSTSKFPGRVIMVYFRTIGRKIHHIAVTSQ